jgi:lipopolysaccharide cholinephosphotransferase
MTELRKLQLIELAILKEFVRICEEKNLRYYILGGTLLGAVRHKGFIPWDDDVDVCMPREDYERFFKYAEEWLGKEYTCLHYKKSADYRYAFGRVCSKSLKVINRSANIPREEFAWIDIIPLDGFPDGKIERFILKVRLSFWWNLNQIAQFDELVDQKRKRSFMGTFLVKVASLFAKIGKHLDYHICLDKLNEILMECPYDSNTEYIINFLAAYGFDETFPRESFEGGKGYGFEDGIFIGPNDFDTVCQIIYGDYMTLPPESERNKHNLEIVE